MSRLPLVSVAALLAIAACAGEPARTGRSGVEGQILLGPRCPVERPGSPCPDLGAQGEVRARRGSGEQVAAQATGPDGRFRLALAPGSYVLEATARGAMSCSPENVRVPESGYAGVTIRCDTGIR